MDEESKQLIYVTLFLFSTLALLFTSYNVNDNIIGLVIIYGMMVITVLSTFYALDCVKKGIINYCERCGKDKY